MSKKALKNGHAEHIHANCDCQYAVRLDGRSTVEGYDPDEYLEMYENAEGSTTQEKLNSMRRAIAAEKRGKNSLQSEGADGIIAADERDNLDTIETRSVTSIQHGFSAFPEDDVLSEYIQKVTPESGYYDAGMHGTSEAVCFGTKSTNMSPRTLANIIRSREDYTAGENIRLLSCSTGKSSSGDYCFAGELANALGVTAKAPNDTLYILSNGAFYVGNNATGEFIEYTPNQRRRLK